MARLFLLIILGFVSALYFPDSRAALTNAAEPVLTPLRRWQTQHEMGEVAREIQTFERENYGQLPNARSFSGWLTTRFSDVDVTTDSWGQPYAFVARRDSFYVVSYGPDGLPRTGDDVSTGRMRMRRR